MLRLALALLVVVAATGCIVIANPGPAETCVCSASGPQADPQGGGWLSTLLGFAVVDVRGPVGGCQCAP